jgi:hypothetical protein
VQGWSNYDAEPWGDDVTKAGELGYSLPTLKYTGAAFSGKISEAITMMRSSSTWKCLPALILALAGTTDQELHVYTTAQRITASEQYVIPARDRRYYLHKIKAAIYPFDPRSVRPMLVPPARSLTAVITAAAMTAVAVIAAASVIKVASKKLRTWRSEKRQMKIRSLQEEIKQFDFTQEEFEQLDRKDQREYMKAYQKTAAKIRRFNAIGEMFGLTTYDIRNDWVEVPEPTSSAVRDGSATMFTTLKDQLLETDSNNAMNESVSITGSNKLRGLSDVTPEDVSLVDIFNAIKGFSSSTPLIKEN